MARKYIMLSLEDERIKNLSGVLGNKICKKIIDLLAENDLSEKDIADVLVIPLNTVEYNLKKLINAGFAEKTRKFFWSKKGKKIPTYRLSNKSILISLRSDFSSVSKFFIPTAVLSVIGALIIRQYFLLKKPTEDAVLSFAQRGAEAGPEIVKSAEILTSQLPASWVWFLAGAIFSMLMFLIFRIIEMKGGVSKR